MAQVAMMQNQLRAEIQSLKLKLVKLETAESENVKLRKELSTIKQSTDEEKTRNEIDFLNRLTAIAKENSTKVEELESKLAETIKVNRTLSSQLNTTKTNPEIVADKIRDIELIHKKDIATIIDGNRAQVDILEQELSNDKTKMDELSRRLDVQIELNSRQPFQTVASGGDTELKDQVQRLKIENTRLKNSIQQSETSAKNHDISIIQIERRNHDLKMSCQKLEKEVKELKGLTLSLSSSSSNRRSFDGGSIAMRSSFDSISSSDGKGTELKMRFQTLESELKTTNESLKIAMDKNISLNYELEKASSSQNQNEPEMQHLQLENDALMSTCKKLENKVQGVNLLLQKAEEENTNMSMEIKEIRDLLILAEKENTDLMNESESQQRSSSIIQHVESNLKREKDINYTKTEALRKGFEAKQSDETRSLREENRKLLLDVNQLQQKLEKERKQGRDLCKEVSDLKNNATMKSFSSPQKPKSDCVSFKSPDRIGEQFGSPKIGGGPMATPLPMLQEGTPSSRSSVKGLASRFDSDTFNSTLKTENSSSPIKSPIKAPPPVFNNLVQNTLASDEIANLRKDLRADRRQISELEEELTRQCEINCSLLKEVNSLSLETEKHRNEVSHQFKKVDEQEVNKLKSIVKDVTSELEFVFKARDELERRDRMNMKNFDELQNQVKEKVKELEKTHITDKEKISRWQLQVKALGKELVDTKAVVKSLKRELKEKSEEGPVFFNGNHEKEVQEMKEIIEEKERKIRQIMDEKEQLAFSIKENEVEVDEIKKLESENESLLRKFLEESAERQAAEAKVKHFLLTHGSSSKSVIILRERNAVLKFEVEKLTKKVSELTDEKKKLHEEMNRAEI